jgi:hypothetical protein
MTARRPSLSYRFGFTSSLACALVWASTAAAAEKDGIEFFEAKIRPVLVEKCYSCHSAKAKILQAGLYLDTREGLLKGGDSGPAVVVGKPDEGTLLSALRYDGYEMPPSGKLADGVIADFEKWIAMGLPDPRVGSPAVAKAATINIEEGKKFWAFQPVKHPQLPEVQDAAWPSDPLDRFVLAKLEEKKLQPSAEADPAALARRLYFDLVGLPPPPDVIEKFAREYAKSADKATASLVDSLLASPHFGERWGRHWLDIARFAESSGGGRSMVFKEAWRYRDYVLNSFNQDKPLPQFILEQLAGDLLEHKTDAETEEHLTATAYLLLGATNYEEQDKKVLEMDIADEQIEAVGKGLLGMTIGCARCHDHKFDPIPTSDYYALAGIFRSTNVVKHENVSAWIERPLPMTPEQAKAIARHDDQVKKLRKEIQSVKASMKSASGDDGLASGPLPVESLPGIVVDDVKAKKIGRWIDSTSVKTYVGAGYVHDGDAAKGEMTITFQPEFEKRGLYEVRLAYAPGKNRAAAVPVEILSIDGEFSTKVDMREQPEDGRFVSLGKFPFDDTNQWFVMISNQDTTGTVAVDCVQFVPVVEAAAVADKGGAKSDGTKSAAAKSETKDGKADSVAANLAKMEAEMKKLVAAAPPRPMAMAVGEADLIADCKLCIRGNVHTQGPAVPRGMLQVATRGPAPTIPKDASGRRELAQWIGDKNNPLTARVYVNRVWHHLFGTGLVRTVDNFGSTGETPSHPELLDHLAARFMDEGWSTKRLIREIVLSRTYRQSSAENVAALKADPENRLLWRMNRKRLDAESIRDAILTVSGKLDEAFGGPNVADPEVMKSAGTITPSEYGFVFKDFRRSVYTPAFRNRMLELFEAFDMADQNTVAGKRNVSTVAPQALYMLNAPFVMDQARFAAERALAASAQDDGERVERAFREALGRSPTARERRTSLAAVTVSTDLARNEENGDPRVAAWERFFQALFGCLDFRYLD